MTLRIGSMFLALLFVQCEKEETTTAPSTPATDVTSTVFTDEAVDKTDIAVPEDFEDEAFTTIDEDNLEEQLDALEREISGDTE